MIAGHEARSEGHDASIAVGKFPNLETHAYARVRGLENQRLTHQPRHHRKLAGRHRLILIVNSRSGSSSASR
jgi:hypothetical protein